jgi:uncharacterized MAPEG superfamily protein
MGTLMTLSSGNAAFTAYAIATLILVLNMMLLWGMSGSVRGKVKSVPNPEDADAIVKGAAVSLTDPPEVARVLRAHRNAVDNILPFLFLGLIYVMLGAPVLIAQIIFGVFTAARVLHSIVYIAGKQPWRSLIYLISVLAMLALMEEVIRALVR